MGTLLARLEAPVCSKGRTRSSSGEDQLAGRTPAVESPPKRIATKPPVSAKEIGDTVDGAWYESLPDRTIVEAAG
jgi:hypothetical protein